MTPGPTVLADGALRALELRRLKSQRARVSTDGHPDAVAEAVGGGRLDLDVDVDARAFDVGEQVVDAVSEIRDVAGKPNGVETLSPVEPLRQPSARSVAIFGVCGLVLGACGFGRLTLRRHDELRRWRLPKLVEGYRHVVVDTPPADVAVTRSALLAVDEVIVPIGPTPLDLDRLGATLDLLAEVEPVNALRWTLPLTRLRRGTRSSRETRAALEDLEMPVMRAEVPLREAIGLSFGVAGPSDDYGRVVEELLGVGVSG